MSNDFTKNTTKNSRHLASNSSKQHTLWFMLAVLGFIVLMLTTAGSMALAIANQETVARGIRLDGTSIEGLTQVETHNFIKKTADKRIRTSTINLKYENQQWKIEPSAIGLTVDVDNLTKDAYAPGHTGSMLDKLIENIQCAVYGKELTMTADYNGESLDQQIKQIAAQIDRSPVSGYCSFGADGSIVRTPAITGQKLNTEELITFLHQKIVDLKVPNEITLEPAITQPPVTDADLKHIDTVLSSYTSTFSYGGNRGQNINIAANAINHSFVKSNGEFSFNDTVGYRNAANGYLNAPVIVAGKVEDDLGGGVCQVSSTLYNAILLAGLTPTERTRHFFPSSYVPAGQDATVADGVLDFKFRNPYPHGVYILTSCYRGTLVIYILGCSADTMGRTYSLENEVLKGGIAPVVRITRVYYQDGKETAREELHTDHYDIPVNDDNNN